MQIVQNLILLDILVHIIQGASKKMSDSEFILKSVPGVQFYFFRGVLESEFLARSIWTLELYPSIIWNVFKMQKMHAHDHTKKPQYISQYVSYI